MKRLLLSFAATLLLTSVGCVHHNTCSSCNGSGDQGALGHAAGGGGGGLSAMQNPNQIPRLGIHNYPDGFQPQGPPSASVTYPYYTTRGPRDFLMDDPNSIGP